jgi:outer membrane lipoprotein-sorting protein
MISGRDSRVLRLAAACVALFCAPAHAQQREQPGQAWGITELMQTLAQVKSASGQFTERKTMRILSEPLLASGTLLYLAPDQVQKITVLPQRERVAVRGDTVTIEGGQDERGRTLSLADYPEIGGIVEGIRATLAGDLPTLRRFYAVQLDGSAADWRLVLQPTALKLQKFVKQIRIAGSGNKVHTVETEDGDGDLSQMSIVEDVQ